MRPDIVTFVTRPELADKGLPSHEIWPEYNLHGDVANPLWWRLAADLPQFQLGVIDPDSGALLAEGHTAPCAWSGRDEDLPDSFDAALVSALELADSGTPGNTLCALAVEISPRARGGGLARIVLEAMRDLAAQHGFGHVIAPVRPSWKEHYPLTPIERYVRWRRDDELPLDPWLRVHERLGARLGPPLPESLRITGTIAEWESWTGMIFPESGEYVFPHGLAPLTIDVAADLGAYWEPNVWVIHTM